MSSRSREAVGETERNLWSIYIYRSTVKRPSPYLTAQLEIELDENKNGSTCSVVPRKNWTQFDELLSQTGSAGRWYGSGAGKCARVLAAKRLLCSRRADESN